MIGKNSSLRIVATRTARGCQRKKDAADNIMRDKDGKPLLNNYRVRLWQAVITPKRFDYFKATRSYLPAADIQNPAIEGINPFRD